MAYEAAQIVEAQQERGSVILDATMGQILKAILRELDRQGKSRYWLAKEVTRRAGVHEDTTYRFLRGEHDAGANVVDAVLDALKLRIVPRQTRTARKGR